MEISVIVPVYNEYDNLQPLFERLKSTLDKLGTSYELIFVNDGSTDKTDDADNDSTYDNSAEVAASSNTEVTSPATGDSSSIWIWRLMLAIALGSITGLSMIKKKEK